MLFRSIVSVWKKETSRTKRDNKQIDVIVASSYGATQDALAQATRQAVTRANFHLKRQAEAYLAFCHAPHCFPGSDDFERREKLTLLQELHIPSDRQLEAGSIGNTIEEARAIQRAAHERGISFNTILVVAGEVHSRRAYKVWRRVVPKAKIMMSCFDCQYEHQENHPIRALHSRWGWLRLNMVAYLVLCLPFGLGLRLLERKQHQGSGFQ